MQFAHSQHSSTEEAGLEKPLDVKLVPQGIFRAARKISDQIDEELRRERIALQHMRGPKILLLGSGDSGKTTVLKQMKILHGDGFDEKERDAFRVRIYDNILDSMKALVYALETLGVQLAVPSNEVHAKRIVTHTPRVGERVLTPEIVESLQELWKDAGIQQCLQRSNEFFIQDTAE
ncbi:guanine nucleotide-binding protein subunit alpha [Rhizophlyctis rosea]|uniref:Guanine nucleotide-binding protein subunit alpha n=1 Tax=Rhizophlyctis rosea TaxID=64517 RepID=A0AAD5SIP9_9FUNG|nr:guanine nucleotide-binding protein subunit alpha [Rhizophlyctis rosea]